MKKLGYLFMSLALAAGVSSCSKSKESNPEYLGMVAVLSYANEDMTGMEEVARVAYPEFTNAPGSKVGDFIYSYMAADKQMDVAFDVVYSTGKCEVTWFSDADAENIKVTYMLNAAGNPTTASAVYTSDNKEYAHYTFSYDGGMLTKILEDSDLEPSNWTTWYEATYENLEQKSINVLGAVTPVSTGTTLNNFGLDPTYYFAFYGAPPMESPAVLAAYCGLLPHTKHIPSLYDHPEMALDVITSVENNVLTGFTIDPLLDVDFLYLY